MWKVEWPRWIGWVTPQFKNIPNLRVWKPRSFMSCSHCTPTMGWQGSQHMLVTQGTRMMEQLPAWRLLVAVPKRELKCSSMHRPQLVPWAPSPVTRGRKYHPLQRLEGRGLGVSDESSNDDNLGGRKFVLFRGHIRPRAEGRGQEKWEPSRKGLRGPQGMSVSQQLCSHFLVHLSCTFLRVTFRRGVWKADDALFRALQLVFTLKHL